MDYTHKTDNNYTYTFPKLDDTTFLEAYADKECTQKIEGVFEHQGTLDYETCTATGRVQNIYVKLAQGERFRITTAEQFAEHATTNGYFEIMNDLDFYAGDQDKQVDWPTILRVGTFTGKIFGTDGNAVVFKNIVATHSSDEATTGGLFGAIAKSAEIKNVAFEKVTFDLAYTGQRLRNTTFGLFAGFIEEDAGVENVTVGGTFKIGGITLGEGWSINLYANGDVSGLTKGAVALQVYGQELGDEGYLYMVLPYDKDDATQKTVTVSETHEVTITFTTGELYEKENYDIEYQAEVN